MGDMLDGFGDAFLAFGRDWRLVHFNRAAGVHFGLSPDALNGQPAWEDPRLAGESPLRGLLVRVKTGASSLEIETTSCIRPNRWFQLRAFPLQDGFGASYHDITQRVDLAGQEREQSERLDLALATAGYGEWTWNPRSDTVTFSDRAAEMMGAAPGLVLSAREQIEYLHPEDREAYREAVGRAVAERTYYEGEYRYFHQRDGDLRWMKVRGRARFAADGELVSVLGVLTDTTKVRMEAERSSADRTRLAESEARFRAMADSAPSPIWVTDELGGLEFANEAFRALAGLGQDDLAGDGWMSLMHPDDRAMVATLRAEARKGLRPNHWEARFRIDGEWRWMRTASQARFDNAGAFRGYVGLAMDVTDTRRAEAHQALLINELNHRVKNTLATIQSLARQSLRPGVDINDGRERLTDRLLALSAAHNVLTRENWEGADLAQIAQEAVRPYDDPAGDRIRIDGPNARLAPSVALAVSMALHELATNAMKYGALSVPGGSVRLDWTRPADEGPLHLEWEERGGPSVTAPQAKGFGARLLASLTGELGAPADIDYRAEGVVCRLRAPVL